jgi:hypothetical protein
MVLGSTQLLTEMSTRNVPGGKERPAREVDNFTAICEPIVWILWDLQRLTTLRASMAWYRDSFTLPLCALFLYFYVQRFYRTDIFHLTFNYLFFVIYYLFIEFRQCAKLIYNLKFTVQKNYGYENIIKHGK